AITEHAIERVAGEYVDFVERVLASRTRRNLIAGVARELSVLGIQQNDENNFTRGVAMDVAAISHFKVNRRAAGLDFVPNAAGIDEQNGHPQAHSAISSKSESISPQVQIDRDPGRLPKLEGVDYKRAAEEYLGRLSEERRHHLRTKPFYNLRHKPTKYKNEGMDEDMHRHFCDFANIAVRLALPAGSRILDVGCGSGWLSEYFARLGYEVKGIDISPALIDMSRERVDGVPYGVDHETPLRCTFEIHDVEAAPLAEKFDAIVCYDSLHHFEDERSVIRNLAQMLPIGGQLFILEGRRPAAGSVSETELLEVMREFQTLESPFDDEYLRALLDENGFAIVGDYVSVNGLFEREMLEGQRLPLDTISTDYYYLNCQKVCAGRGASTVPDSRAPGILSARLSLKDPINNRVAPGSTMILPISVENMGDTLWLTSDTSRAGVVVPAVRVFDDSGALVNEFHGEPPLPRAIAPGQTVEISIEYQTPQRAGDYKIIIDLVDQNICWFEQKGSQPLIIEFEVWG
ncbi:MAG TPA: methyltransferase domain-containing protein, partial [Pyrinomonadaceae bacterium]